MQDFNFNETFEKLMQEHGLKTAVILGHMNPDGDAAGSVMGLAHYIKDVYPEYTVLPHLATTLDKGPKIFTLTDQEFDPFTFPKAEKYAVIVCDTATRARIIGYELFENAEITMAMDHHASNERYADINYVKISEACAQNVFETLDWERWEKAEYKSGLCPNAPEYFYLGILHDTHGFQRANQEVLSAASKLLELGVDHSKLMKTLLVDTLDSLHKRFLLLDMTTRVLDEKAAYVFLTKEKCEEQGFTYEDIHPISEILRDCEDLELGFTMFEEKENLWRCSFRSDGKWINVNELLNPFGGGGHAAAAGLRIHHEHPEQLIQQILDRVIEMRCN